VAVFSVVQMSALMPTPNPMPTTLPIPTTTPVPIATHTATPIPMAMPAPEPIPSLTQSGLIALALILGVPVSVRAAGRLRLR